MYNYKQKVSDWYLLSVILSRVRLLTLSPEAMNPSKHFDSLTSLGLQLMDFNLKNSQHSSLGH